MCAGCNSGHQDCFCEGERKRKSLTCWILAIPTHPYLPPQLSRVWAQARWMTKRLTESLSLSLFCTCTLRHTQSHSKSAYAFSIHMWYYLFSCSLLVMPFLFFFLSFFCRCRYPRLCISDSLSSLYLSFPPPHSLSPWFWCIAVAPPPLWKHNSLGKWGLSFAPSFSLSLSLSSHMHTQHTHIDRWQRRTFFLNFFFYFSPNFPSFSLFLLFQG